MTLFFEISAALVLAAVCGTIFYFFRQPTIVGFIFAGLIIGYFGYLHDKSTLELVEGFSSIGVALLLFIVGLEMRLKELKEVGIHAIVAGVVQVFAAFAISFWAASLLGITGAPAFYISAALSFSSTVIVVKLLSEKRDLNSLYGRLAVGILLVQDVFAMLILIFLSGLGEGGSPGFFGFFFALLKGGIFVFLAVLASKYAPKLLGFVSRSPDLLYLFSLAWAVGISALFASPFIGLSVEIGGFLAGLVLANSSEHFQIGARLKPLRDFFLIILFIGLGARMISGEVAGIIPAVIIFSVVVLVLNLLIVTLALSFMGYRSRTAFLTGLTMTQISEFGFILMFLGSRLGHVGSSHVSIIAVVGIITIFTSSYFIIYGSKIYSAMKPILKVLDLRKRFIEERAEETLLQGHVILVGAHRMGQAILRSLTGGGTDFVAVDFDPRVVEDLRSERLPVIYGDISDPEIQEQVGLNKCRVLISTTPDPEDNFALLESLKKNNPGAKTILTAQTEHEAELLYEAGADYVILPRLIGGAEIARLLAHDPDLQTLPALKERDVRGVMET